MHAHDPIGLIIERRLNELDVNLVQMKALARKGEWDMIARNLAELGLKASELAPLTRGLSGEGVKTDGCLH